MTSNIKSIRAFFRRLGWLKHKQGSVQSFAELQSASARAAKVGYDSALARNTSVYAGFGSGCYETNVNQTDDVTKAWGELKENNRPLVVVHHDLNVTKSSFPSHQSALMNHVNGQSYRNRG